MAFGNHYYMHRIERARVVEGEYLGSFEDFCDRSSPTQDLVAVKVIGHVHDGNISDVRVNRQLHALCGAARDGRADLTETRPHSAKPHGNHPDPRRCGHGDPSRGLAKALENNPLPSSDPQPPSIRLDR